jgi:hypothetical protein
MKASDTSATRRRGDGCSQSLGQSLIAYTEIQGNFIVITTIYLAQHTEQEQEKYENHREDNRTLRTS